MCTDTHQGGSGGYDRDGGHSAFTGISSEHKVHRVAGANQFARQNLGRNGNIQSHIPTREENEYVQVKFMHAGKEEKGENTIRLIKKIIQTEKANKTQRKEQNTKEEIKSKLTDLSK